MSDTFEVNGRKMQPIDGLQLRFRTRGHLATATIWIDDVAKCELATLDLRHVTAPDDPTYVAWRKAVGDVFIAHVKRVSEEAGVSVPEMQGVLVRPDRTGEASLEFDA